MQHTNETPRKEITISGVVLKVIAPFEEGHTLTAGEANVLNQTLAENLRNNFAGRAKEGKEQGVSVEQLQSELDAYINEYEFGARRSGAPAVDPVTKIALVMARDSVRKALTKAGKSVKDYTAEQINTLAQRAIETRPEFKEKAAIEHERRLKAAAETLELDLSEAA